MFTIQDKFNYCYDWYQQYNRTNKSYNKISNILNGSKVANNFVAYYTAFFDKETAWLKFMLCQDITITKEFLDKLYSTMIKLSLPQE